MHERHECVGAYDVVVTLLFLSFLLALSPLFFIFHLTNQKPAGSAQGFCLLRTSVACLGGRGSGFSVETILVVTDDVQIKLN